MKSVSVHMSGRFKATCLASLAGVALHVTFVHAIPCTPPGDPFEVIDPQVWVNPHDMVWDDFVPPPGVNWADPDRAGSERNFNIALVAIDYPNMPFVVTQPVQSTIFKNPQPIVSDWNITRANVARFYQDLLNTPSHLNRNHTLHEYWMEDSAGRFGVDLTAFGPYEMPANSWQYGIENRMNPGGCPAGASCNLNIRTDALRAWRNDVGDETADSYELVFITSAGQDESSTWQEFGEMLFGSPDEVTDAFGPPAGNGPNFASTRYVNWTSWASAATLWPNAGSGSSTQAESSGMGVYAHELSHLLRIADNYNNPYGEPAQRSYTGPWSMMSRGSFNGPGGPHSRWQIPALQGGAMGSLHTVRDKLQLGLADRSSVLTVRRSELAAARGGVLVADVTARCVAVGEGELLGVRIALDEDGDRTPACDARTTPFCDGGPYDYYEVEVVDRMGADSFQPDAGVHLSKTKERDVLPFQWTVDANPQDVGLVDFALPDGTERYVTVGDYRQLADALFHAGTRSGSAFEYVDAANGLHFYVLAKQRSEEGELRYSVAVRSLEAAAAGRGEAGQHGVVR
ncbi:M6 metalloprotease [Sodiomyces alkalinus F11]|uniref:M6 metalloprotease n=1 Tax=Sodiomyces alkalinus (strain CBS 110278 / VKM F-3762 / F11) TaxID=1314773 RepID=A0A3N2Q1H1_SODAK|nr:M6 metalloprotease [Sodiomyces alkalinus F11]ROT40455.1 M6 metalloprotease [Sodiomyces alkalinus F11]